MRRIQRKRTKGWRMPPNTTSVTRPGNWGNPFIAADQAITKVPLAELFETWLHDPRNLPSEIGRDWIEAQAGKRRWMLDNLWRLTGKNLACWCADDAACHATVLLRLANAQEITWGIIITLSMEAVQVIDQASLDDYYAPDKRAILTKIVESWLSDNEGGPGLFDFGLEGDDQGCWYKLVQIDPIINEVIY